MKLKTLFGVTIDDFAASEYASNVGAYSIIHWKQLNEFADYLSEMESEEIDDKIASALSELSPMSASRQQDAWTVFMWHGILSTFSVQNDMYKMSCASRLAAIMGQVPKHLYFWATYVTRVPRPEVYAVLRQGEAEYAEVYFNHCALFIHAYPDMDHSAYATITN